MFILVDGMFLYSADSALGEAFYRAFQAALNGYFIKKGPNLTKLISLSVDHPKLVRCYVNHRQGRAGQ